MKNDWTSKLSFKTLSLFSVILLIFGLFFHLSYPVFIGDESIRALVAFEMLESGNYLVPTINGEYYYAKPPIYNWFIAISYYVFGGVSEFSSRFPTVIFTLLYGYAVYVFNSKYFGKQFGFILAMMVVTCGRIFFYDSMLGLIDIGYSALIYVHIYLIYHLFNQQKYLKLFLVTYLLTAIGFLIKGYPSLVFQALSVGIWFMYKRRFLLLFSIKHILGILLLGSIVGGYYYIYGQYNDVQNTVAPLLDQAMRRTVSRYSIIDVLKHLFTYPLENLYHFLPWTLFVILLFRKDLVTKLKSHPFIEFNAIMFLTNIIVYWISPEVFPRYILMLVPFVFTVYLYLYWEVKDTWNKKILNYIISGFIVVLPLAMIGSFFIPSVTEVEYYTIKIIVLFVLMGLIAYTYYRRKDIRLLLFVMMLLMVRVGFDTFVLPDRKNHSSRTFYKNEALRIAELVKDKPLNIYKKSRVHFIDSYYIMSKRGMSMKRIHDDFKVNEYYILDTAKYEIKPMVKVDSFRTWEANRLLYVVKKGE